MAKRPNRLPPLQHEQHQLDQLKTMLPNTTPAHQRPLSDGLIDVALAALDLVAALENSHAPNFEPLYARVDALADLADQPAPLPEAPLSPPSVPLPSPPLPTATLKGITTMKTTIVGRPDTIDIQGETVTL